MTFKFKINPGDLVRLKSGKKPILVIEVKQGYCKTNEKKCTILYGTYRIHEDIKGRDRLEYTQAGFYTTRARYIEDFVLYDGPEQMSQKLFQTNEKEIRYGTMLGHNSNNDIVLEMRGENGKVEAFKKGDVTEVIPHTVGIKHSAQTQEIHIAVKKDAVQKGDMLVGMSSGNVFLVTSIDSRNRSPSKGEKYRLITTTELDSDNAD